MHSIRTGVALIKFAWFLTICLTLLLLTISLLPVFRVRIDGDTAQAIPYIILGLILVAGLLNLIGSFLYTRDDPRLGEAASAGGVRLLVRLSVTVGLCVGIAGVVLLLSGVDAEPSTLSGPRNKPVIHFNPTGIAVGLVGGLASFLSAASLMHYTRWLAGRVPDPALVQRIDGMKPLVYVVYALALVLSALGQASLLYVMVQAGLGPWPMLVIALVMLALPLIAIFSLWRMLSRIKVHLDALCLAADRAGGG